MQDIEASAAAAPIVSPSVLVEVAKPKPGDIIKVGWK